MDLASIIAQVQAKRAASIPGEWKITAEKLDSKARPIDMINQADILSAKETELTEQNASDILKNIHSGNLTSQEVLEAFLKRAAVAHQIANCLTEFFPDEARAVAKRLDEKFQETGRPVGPLHGLPIAIKDMYDLQGHLTTVGYVSWHENKAETDASLVRVMKDAGAVIFAKTAMPQTGMALETNSNLWGRTLNTYSSEFGSGGSSGGDGVLVGLRGAPAAPLASDIGGSIRAPAAFNGLYALRPTSERIPRKGLRSTVPGQISIKTSCGPITHSLQDLKLLANLILTHPTLPFEGSCPPGSWRQIETPTRKLKIGLLLNDGAVQPHPPITRGLKEAAEKLKAAGHEVIEFKLPFDAWEASLLTFALYWQTGAAEAKAYIAASGETSIHPYAKNLEIYDTKALSTQELYALNTKQMNHKWAFSQAWQDANPENGSECPFDAILCPVSPMAAVPHDFPVYWGYTSLWNLLDYPSVVMPVDDLVVDLLKDGKDPDYVPHSNPFDKENWEVYEPERWQGQPVTLQVVGRPYMDEELIAVCEAIDKVINGQVVKEQ